MRDLRDLLTTLQNESPQTVHHVSEEIDPRECDHFAYETLLAQRGHFPWLVFENVRSMNGSRWPGLFVSEVFSNLAHIIRSYDLKSISNPFEMALLFAKGLDRDKKPELELVESGKAPIHEIVYQGDDATLDILPFYRNCEKDARPGWQTPIWISRQFETGRYNLGWHRSLYIDPKRMTVRFYPPRHLNDYFRQYVQAGYERVPVIAVLNGHHPVFLEAAQYPWPMDVDEYDAAAGVYETVTGHKLRVTPSVTWGDELLVPADAEIVAEGYITNKYFEAGPWGDNWRYYTPSSKQPIFEVTAVTMKKNPIMHCVVPPVDNIAFNPTAAVMYNSLKNFFPKIKGINFPFLQTLIISYESTTPGDAVNLAASCLTNKYDHIKNVIVVDEDINPYNMRDVFYAICTRVDSRRDVHILPVMTGPNDPTLMKPSQYSDVIAPVAGGLIIDATKPLDCPHEVAMVPADALRRMQLLLEKRGDPSITRMGDEWWIMPEVPVAR